MGAWRLQLHAEQDLSRGLGRTRRKPAPFTVDGPWDPNLVGGVNAEMPPFRQMTPDQHKDCCQPTGASCIWTINR
jgi:hypothetical protein